jgi:hypothetical protein
MRDFGTVLEQMERPVFHVKSGLVLKSLMEAIIYRLPQPALVLVRTISMPNATVVTGSYTVILGDTLGDWKRNLEELDLMIWKPLPLDGSGLDLSYWK